MGNNLPVRLFFGSILIFLGLGFLLDQFSIFNFGSFLGSFWALIIIALGLFLLVKNPRNFLPGLIVLFFGVLLQIDALGLINFSIWNLWPLILVFIGISVLIKPHPRYESNKRLDSEPVYQDEVNIDAIFWGFDKKVTSDNFKDAKLSAIFGGGKLDLRDAKISKDGAIINASAVFGGIEILVPSNVRIINSGTGIFGAFENNVRNQTDSDTPTITITGEAIFGGVEIK